MNNNLIHGKNPRQNIVGIEDNKNGTTELFIQTSTGNIISESVLNEYWILTDGPTDEFCQELDGDGYYKYKNTFTLRDDFEYAKKHFRKFGDRAYFINDPKEAFMVANGYTYYKGLKHSEVSVLSFDIETTTLEHTKDAKVLIISNTFRDSNGNKERKLFCYDEYKTDKDFFEDWCSWVREKDPSIITGHNIFGFDIPYLDFCSNRAGVELTLGRKGKSIRFNYYSSKFRKEQSQFIDYKKYYIFGREIVDTFFLSIKYDTVNKKYESYGLKQIIKAEELEIKDRQFYDASLIRKNYKIPEEWKKIKAYALHDADDALALWDLQGPSYFYMSQSVPKSFQEIVCGATGSQLNSIMVRAYLQDGHSLPKASQAGHYEGAISMGNSGIWRNVLKWDVSSLYPSIMIEYQVYDQKKDPKGYFKELVETFTKQRLEHKKLSKKDKYYDDLQLSEKTFINSAYGFLGTNGLLFNSPLNAAFVTEKGREILNKAFNWLKNNSLQLVNADTDSISFTKNGEELTDEFQTELLKDFQQGFPEKISWEYDGYYSTMIILAPKNYILYDGKKIKTKGSSLRDTKKEPALREFLDECIRILVHDEPHEKLVETYHIYIKEALAIKDIKRWCSKKTITEKVETSERANETKLKDAIAGTEYKQSDKVYVFFTENEQLCLAENYKGDYNKDRLVEKLYKSTQVFKNILPTKELFKNYKLKKNKKLLQELN